MTKLMHITLSLRVIFLFALMSMVVACSTSKKSKDKVQIIKGDDENKGKEPTPTKVDTVISTPKVVDPVKDKDPKMGPADYIKQTYRIALLFPLDASSGVIDNRENLRFIQYYGGVKLAGQKLEELGSKFEIDVIDTKEGIYRSSLQKKWDLIIGPYASASSESTKNDLQTVMNFGKENQIPVVSPWYSTSKASEANPYYIQLKPNIREHYNSIIEHVVQSGLSDQVVLVGRDNGSDIKWFDYFQQVAKAHLPKKGDRPFAEILVKEATLVEKNDVFKSKIDAGKTVFIFPNYSYNDENYLVAAMTKLLGERNNKNVTVYGMPFILDSEKIGFQFYSGLKMRLVVPDFVEKDNENVKEFTRNFYQQYKTIPAADAFEGYDVMTYLGNALIKYGKYFAPSLLKEKDYLLQTSYDVRPVYEEGDDSFSKIQFYENKHLNIIEFRGNKFVRL